MTWAGFDGRITGQADAALGVVAGRVADAAVHLRAAAQIDWDGSTASRYAARAQEALAALVRLNRAVDQARVAVLAHARGADVARGSP